MKMKSVTANILHVALVLAVFSAAIATGMHLGVKADLLVSEADVIARRLLWLAALSSGIVAICAYLLREKRQSEVGLRFKV